jgi:hypothetical protein
MARQRRRHGNIVAIYDYYDEKGLLLFQVVREEPKAFYQRRPWRSTDDHAALVRHGVYVDGPWVWSLHALEPSDTPCPERTCGGLHREVLAVRRVLFRLPELLAADPELVVYLCEGEKDVLALVALGCVATTNPGGAKKWRAEYGEPFHGRHVVIIPDNDDDGRKHVDEAAAALCGVAERLQVLALPGLPEHGDVSDWIAAGGTREQLEALVAATPDRAAEDDDANEGGKPDPEAGDEHAKTRVGNDQPGTGKTAKGKLPTQATRLVRLAAQAELFHTPDYETFATIVVDEHAETWSLKSAGFRLWLLHLFHVATGTIPSAQALQDAIQTLRSQALFDGAEHSVFTRLGEQDGAIYLDRAAPDWSAIRVGPLGWEVVKNPPVKFRRSSGMLALPEPVHGGSITELARFVNVWDESAWGVVVAWVIATFRPQGPYPILVLNGEQGSAKSTLARVLRNLIDPNKVQLRRPPRDERDLMIAASNSWVIALDNLSHLQPWLADALCSLATGGGFGTRELYSDQDEVLFDATRPIVVNGIEEIATRSDFLDRALMVTLPAIADEHRRAERGFWSTFEIVRPAMLGALLDAVVAAVRSLPTVHLERRPRMADFAEWVTAAESGLGWAPGTFMAAYAGNRADANLLALDANPLSGPVRALVDEGDFEGTVTALLNALLEGADDAVTRQPGWPKSARTLSGLLRRLTPNLRAVGVQVEFLKGHHPRRVQLMSVPIVPIVPDAPKAKDGRDIRRDTTGDARDAGGSGRDARRDANPRLGRRGDGRDANIPPSSTDTGEDDEAEWSRDIHFSGPNFHGIVGPCRFCNAPTRYGTREGWECHPERGCTRP